jgi:hypothetical protein
MGWLKGVEGGYIDQSRTKYLLKSKLNRDFGKKYLEKCFGPECFFKKLDFPTGSPFTLKFQGLEKL